MYGNSIPYTALFIALRADAVSHGRKSFIPLVRSQNKRVRPTAAECFPALLQEKAGLEVFFMVGPSKSGGALSPAKHPCGLFQAVGIAFYCVIDLRKIFSTPGKLGS